MTGRWLGLCLALGPVAPSGGKASPPAAPAVEACPVLPGTDTQSNPLATPAADAIATNHDALAEYRAGRYEAARAKYDQALAADPGYLPPRLNRASSLVRQERMREAADEVVALLNIAFVPWSREVTEAADLGALRTHAEMQRIDAARMAAARAWAPSLADAIVFVARVREPLKVPASGVGVLALSQEAFAWWPATGRVRQLTATLGRVIGAIPASDGSAIAFVTAQKVVRGEGPARLRGVEVHLLRVATMASDPPLTIAGDVERVGLSLVGEGAGLAVEVRIEGPAAMTGTLVAGRLRPERLRTRQARDLVVTGTGVAGPTTVRWSRQGCAFTVQDEAHPSDGRPSVRFLDRRPRKGTAPSGPGRLTAPFGAGLRGLDF